MAAAKDLPQPERKITMNADNSKHVHDLVYMALGTVLITVCSWISIPTEIPFTLQTMAVVFVCALLGGGRGAVSVLIYILLGAIGVPVFAGMTGGVGKLLGVTGGYIIGFIFTALVMWLFQKFFGKDSLLWTGIAMVLGIAVCYLFGSLWFYYVYASNTGAIGMGTVLAKCVVPFIIPDLVKIALALVLSNRLRKILKDKLD